MWKVHKLGPGLYDIETKLGTFNVFGAIQGYGDFGWLVEEPNGYRWDPMPTKSEAYEAIRAVLGL